MEYTRPIGSSPEYITCPKGHYYDPAKTPVCPVCAEEEKMNRMGRDYGESAVPPTTPMNYNPPQNVENYSPTAAMGGAGTPNHEATGSNTQVDDIDVTRVQGGFSSMDAGGEEQYFNPLVGWLVCVEGPTKGSDYRIFSGYNYIGKDPSMDICIPGDPYISHVRHAMVTFDARSRRFFFGPDSGKNIVRKNDEIVLSPVEIKAKDILEIGNTKLMLVPPCDDTFTWN